MVFFKEWAPALGIIVTLIAGAYHMSERIGGVEATLARLDERTMTAVDRLSRIEGRLVKAEQTATRFEAKVDALATTPRFQPIQIATWPKDLPAEWMKNFPAAVLVPAATPPVVTPPAEAKTE